MKRLRYIDEAKGLGILCITFLHYENGVLPSAVNVFIGSFMITIFYIVAGMMMAMKDRDMPTRELAHRRLRSIGLPYLYWSGIIMIFDCILWVCGYYDTYFIAREAYKTIVLRGIGTLWFLPALFFGEVGWNRLRSKHWGWWLAALLFVLAYRQLYTEVFAGRATNMWKIIEAPFYTINHALTAIVDVAAGYLIYKGLRKINLSRWQEVLSGLFCCFAGFYTASYLQNIVGTAAAGWLWSFCAPILGPVGFILLFKSARNSSLFSYFDYWGRNSLSLMVTHYSIVQVLITIFVTKILNIEFNGWITIYSFLLSLPIHHLITGLLNRYSPKLIRP